MTPLGTPQTIAPTAATATAFRWSDALASRHNWPIAVGVLYVFSVLVNVSWVVEPFRSALDFSWSAVLHWARLSRADFGHEIVFTYGPWGFISQGYHPQTFYLAILMSLLIATAGFYAIYLLATHMTPNRWAASAWIVLVTCLEGTRFQGLQDVRLMVLPWSMLLIHFYVRRDSRQRWDLIAVVAVLALVSQVKFTLFLSSVLVLIAISVDQLLRRRAPWYLAAYVIAYLFFWLAASQSLLSIAPYIYHSWLISQGYTEGVTLYGPHEARDVFLYSFVAVLMLAMIGISQWRTIQAELSRGARPVAPSRWLSRARRYFAPIVPSVALLAAMAAALLLLFKAGFVRRDAHELIATLGAGILAMLAGAAVWPLWKRRIAKAGIIAVVGAALLLTWFSELHWAAKGIPTFLIKTFDELPGRAWSAAALLVGKDRNTNYFIQAMRESSIMRKVPQPVGTVDTYSYSQQSILANDYPYRPRPLIQSYLGYTSALAELDAAFLRSERSPDSIFFGIQPIDDHFPALEDSLSWPELLTRYNPADATCSHVLLRKAAVPRQYELVPLLSYTIPVGGRVQLPESDEPLWVKIHLKRTLGGKLAHAAYKTPPVRLQVRTRSDAVYNFRLLPDVAAGGFLLSPFIHDAAEFMLLYSTDSQQRLKNDEIIEIQVTGTEWGNLNSAYESEYFLELFQLRFPRLDIAAVPGVKEYLEFSDFFKNQCRILYRDAAVSVETLDEGRLGLVSDQRSQLLVPVPKGAKRVRIGYGILRQTIVGQFRSGGAQMTIYAAILNGKESMQADTLFTRTLDPSNVMADRGYQIVEAVLPQTAYDGVVLESIPAKEGLTGMSYWSMPQFITVDPTPGSAR